MFNLPKSNCYLIDIKVFKTRCNLPKMYSGLSVLYTFSSFCTVCTLVLCRTETTACFLELSNGEN